MHKAEQERRLIQILTDLNEVYTVVRGSILMTNPLPSIAQALSILIQEEKQIEVTPSNRLVMESTSLNVNGSGDNKFRTNYNQRGNGAIHNSCNSIKQGYPPAKSRLFCDYCKKPGHTRDNCYKMHGFPQDFKFTKGRNMGSAANVHSQYGKTQTSNGEGADNRVHNQSLRSLTREQYSQLLNLLENFKTNTVGENPNIMTIRAVNFAGPFNEEAFGDW